MKPVYMYDANGTQISLLGVPDDAIVHFPDKDRTIGELRVLISRQEEQHAELMHKLDLSEKDAACSWKKGIFLGFVLGIAASLIASYLWWLFGPK